MPLEIDPAIIGREFDHTRYGPVTAEELIAFARALGETRPEYTEPGPSLVGHPTFCVRYKGDRFYPESIPRTINVRTGFDAGKDIQLGVPVRPGVGPHLILRQEELPGGKLVALLDVLEAPRHRCMKRLSTTASIWPP